MRFIFLSVILLAGEAAAAAGVTVAVQSSGSDKNPMIGFLSQQEQDRVISAHDRALAADPRLKLEEEALKQAGPGMGSATQEEQMAFLEKVRTHQQKVRQAMLVEDPTIGPLLDEIDRHLSQMRAEQAKTAPVPVAPAATPKSSSTPAAASSPTAAAPAGK